MKINIAYMIPCLVGVLIISSCKKMEDVHRQFLDMGETIYVARPDSVLVRGGFQRVELAWPVISDPKINRYKVLWNNGRDSTEGLVQKTTGSDTVRVLLQNLIEGIQYFDIYMYDKLGHSSVKSSVPSMIYGPVYQSSLLSRTYRNIKRVGNNIEINWVPAGDDMVRTEVRYTNTSNNPVEHVISGRSNQSILENVPVLGEITYRTAFLPDSTALDVIYTPFTRINPL